MAEESELKTLQELYAEFQKADQVPKPSPAVTPPPQSRTTSRKRASGSASASPAAKQAKVKAKPKLYQQWTKALFNQIPVPSSLPEDETPFKYRSHRVSMVHLFSLLPLVSQEKQCLVVALEGAQGRRRELGCRQGQRQPGLV